MKKSKYRELNAYVLCDFITIRGVLLPSTMRGRFTIFAIVRNQSSITITLAKWNIYYLRYFIGIRGILFI